MAPTALTPVVLGIGSAERALAARMTIVEALPRTAVGKIAKVGLRASGDPPTTP